MEATILFNSIAIGIGIIITGVLIWLAAQGIKVLRSINSLLQNK